MADQKDLFDNRPPPRGYGDLGNRYDLYDGTPPHEAPETSLEAAEMILPHVNTLAHQVLCCIASAGARGRTDDEIEEILGMRHQTASARRRELFLKGCIHYKLDEHGKMVKRPTRSGRNAFVFVVNPAAAPRDTVITRYDEERPTATT